MTASERKNAFVELALRTARGRCSWFSAVVLFVLLSATGVAAAAAESGAPDHVAACEHHGVRQTRRTHVPPAAVPEVAHAVCTAAPRALPRWRSVTERGLPPPRAPTS